jgi:hypothetical protein
MHAKLNDHETLPWDVHVMFTEKEVAMKDATVGALPFYPVSIFPTDHVRNEEVLLRVKEQRNILHEIRKRKANWIGHILRKKTAFYNG